MTRMMSLITIMMIMMKMVTGILKNGKVQWFTLVNLILKQVTTVEEVMVNYFHVGVVVSYLLCCINVGILRHKS